MTTRGAVTPPSAEIPRLFPALEKKIGSLLPRLVAALVPSGATDAVLRLPRWPRRRRGFFPLFRGSRNDPGCASLLPVRLQKRRFTDHRLRPTRQPGAKVISDRSLILNRLLLRCIEQKSNGFAEINLHSASGVLRQ